MRQAELEVKLPQIDPVAMDLKARFNKLMGYQEQSLEQLQTRLNELKKPSSKKS